MADHVAGSRFLCSRNTAFEAKRQNRLPAWRTLCLGLVCASTRMDVASGTGWIRGGAIALCAHAWRCGAHCLPTGTSRAVDTHPTHRGVGTSAHAGGVLAIHCTIRWRTARRAGTRGCRYTTRARGTNRRSSWGVVVGVPCWWRACRVLATTTRIRLAHTPSHFCPPRRARCRTNSWSTCSLRTRHRPVAAHRCGTRRWTTGCPGD